MARLPSLKSESCNPDASRCSRWVVILRISSRVAVVITCASRNAPAWSLLGGYSFEVPALETAQRLSFWKMLAAAQIAEGWTCLESLRKACFVG